MATVVICIASFITAFNVSVCIVQVRRLRESRRAVPRNRDPRPGEHSILGAIEPEPDHGTDTGEGARTDPRVVSEPVRAWKFQNVTRRADGSLSIYGFGGEYGVEAVAECRAHVNDYLNPRPRNHAVPDEDCSCGFYGLKEKPSEIGPGQHLLEVEMYGKVIPHEKGYRAEKMRVLSITARPVCCGYDENPRYVPYGQPGHNSYELPTFPCKRAASFEGADGRLYCGRHAIDSKRRFFEWEPGPVNCETEWRWA